MNDEEFQEVANALKLVLDSVGSTYASQDSELADMIASHSNYAQFSSVMEEAEDMV